MALPSTHTQTWRTTTTVIAINREHWLEDRFRLIGNRDKAMDAGNCTVAEDEYGAAASAELDELLAPENVERAIDRRVLQVRLTAGEHVREDLVITRRTSGAPFSAMYTVVLPGSSTLERRVEHTSWIWLLVERACDRY